MVNSTITCTGHLHCAIYPLKPTELSIFRLLLVCCLEKKIRTAIRLSWSKLPPETFIAIISSIFLEKIYKFLREAFRAWDKFTFSYWFVGNWRLFRSESYKTIVVTEIAEVNFGGFLVFEQDKCDDFWKEDFTILFSFQWKISASSFNWMY